MLEDGRIEYEFFYRAGDSQVHPAFDRRAFILEPLGVRIHWITDGVYERSEVSPKNLSDEPGNRRGLGNLPLHDGHWNQMRVAVMGDELQLFLNNELIYQLSIEPTNQRTFGLFHWADETEARVRNVVWTGNWPKVLPPVDQQQLAGEGTRFLDERLRRLTAHFEHDFTRKGVPPASFHVHAAAGDPVVANELGARLVVQGDRGYVQRWVAPKLRAHGDFDMQVRFEGLKTASGPDSSAGIFLTAITDDPSTTHSSVYRGLLRKPRTLDRQIVQTEFTRRKPAGLSQTWAGSTAEEAMSGTFRLARRGETLYCLFAELDSPHFRLVHTEQVAGHATLRDGIRLKVAVYAGDGPCRAEVTWKSLSIHAEKITFP
jgi:hypothetical protein